VVVAAADAVLVGQAGQVVVVLVVASQLGVMQPQTQVVVAADQE
jgi:hypothetical protein